MFPNGYIWLLSCSATPTLSEPEPVLLPETCRVCPPSCDRLVFDRVVVSYLIRGGTRVMWELTSAFADAQPYTFQLQVGQTPSNDSDDWEDVGGEVVGQFFAIDGEQRAWGKHKNIFYRVELTTPSGIYYSEPTAGMGTLNRRDWRLAREILRQERLRMRQHAGQLGVLMKRRITGTDCPTCLDYQTKEVRDPNCPDCYGTGKACGYFYPMECIWADMDPRTYRTHLDGGQGRGTINDIKVKARMLNTWMLAEDDVWVNIATDDRYYIHTVQNVAEFRGIPLIADVEMRPAPFTDPIYGIEIPQMKALQDG